MYFYCIWIVLSETIVLSLRFDQLYAVSQTVHLALYKIHNFARGNDYD